MSIPTYPTIYISPTDLTGFKKTKTQSSSSTSINSTFTTQFSIISNNITKVGKLVQLSIVVTKINGHMVLNTTALVGVIPEGYRPVSAISGTFPYILFIGDIGAITINTDGNLYIRSGNTAYIADTSTITISIMYICS